MDCTAYCIASAYDLKALQVAFRPRYQTIAYPGAFYLCIDREEGPCHIFCFAYGAVVCWGMTLAEGRRFIEQLAPYEQKRLQWEETDELTYSYGDTARIFEEEVILPNRDIMTMLALSYALGQSVKLGTFEVIIQRSFDNTKHIPEELARRGWVSLSRREIRTQMGELFITRSSISIHVDALDTPEFFWEYPEYEPLYHLMANHLDLKSRVEVLNTRLKVVHELFEMLASELNHQHSSRLEWTIIWLIIIEVILSLMRDVFRLL